MYLTISLLLAITNTIAVNLIGASFVCVFEYICGIHCQNRITRLGGICVCNLSRYCQSALDKHYINLQPTLNEKSISPHLTNRVFLSNLEICQSGMWKKAFQCRFDFLFPMSEVVHLFICLRAICKIFSMTCLLMYFANFCYWFAGFLF